MNFKQLNEAFDRLAKQSLNENLKQMKAMVEDDTVDPYDLYDKLITYTNDMWVNGVDALIQSTGDKDIELDGQGDVIMLSTSLGYVTWSSDDELQLLVDLVLDAESDKDVEQGVTEFLKSEYNKLAQNINEAWDFDRMYNNIISEERNNDELIKSAIKGDTSAIKLLRNQGYTVKELTNPLQSFEVGTFEVVDNTTGEKYNYDNTLSHYSQIKSADDFEESLSDDRISGNLNLLEKNKARIYNPQPRPAFPGRDLGSLLQNAIADAVQDYYDTTGVIPTRQEVRNAIEPFIQSLSSYEELQENESLDSINEGTNFKRVARYGEFDNGYVMHNWAKMSDKEAENKAKQMSIKNPDDIYYVAYDNVMNPSSDLRWIAGEPYNYSEVQIKNGKPFIKSVTEDRVKLTKNTKLKEDVFYDWKPNTSFAHIKKIYNDVKKRGYKYVNNELEEMHAAMKKVDAKGYTPEQRKQIRSWSEEIWRANRKNESLKESYDDVNSSNAFDVLYDMVELFGCEKMLDALAKAIGTSDLADNLTHICRQYDYDPNPDYVDESLNEEESPKSISDNDNSYPLAFVPTADVKGEDLTNTLCGVLNKAGIKNCCAKKRGGNYHITVICPSGKLATAKTIIENCGFFKEWLPLNRG